MQRRSVVAPLQEERGGSVQESGSHTLPVADRGRCSGARQSRTRYPIAVFDETLGRIEDTEIAERASNAGIYVVPLSSLYITDNRRSGLVFGYGAIRPEDFDEPIRRLLSVIRGLLQTV